jgi:opacity protein-like surface antigen
MILRGSGELGGTVQESAALSCTYSGFPVGGGTGTHLAENWSVKPAYFYMDLGPAFNALPIIRGVSLTGDSKIRDDFIRVGSREPARRPPFYLFALTRFLYANRHPLRSKTL